MCGQFARISQMGGRGQHGMSLARLGQHDLDMGAAAGEGVVSEIRAGQADSAQVRAHIPDVFDREQTRTIDRGGLRHMNTPD